MAGIKIAIVDDVSSFLRGTQKMEDALDRFGGSLDDVARDAQSTGDSMARELAGGVEDGTRDASASVDKLERSFRDLARDSSQHARDTGDAISTETEHGAHVAAESVSEFKAEAVSNFSEVASSFTGDMSQAADGVQGILGGLAGALPGPLGIISGLLGAVGGAWLANWQKNTDEVKQLVSDMFDDMIASGNAYVSEDFINTKVAELVKDTDKLATATTLARLSGIGMRDALRAMAGDTDAAARARAGLADVEADLRTQYDQLADKQGAQALYIAAETKVVDGLKGSLDDSSEAAKKAAGQMAAYSIATSDASTSAKETTDRLDGIAKAAAGIPAVTTTTVKVVPDTTALDRELRKKRSISVPIRGMWALE